MEIRRRARPWQPRASRGRPRVRWPSPAERAIDISISALGLVVAAPVMVAAAIAIKLDSPGPVIYSGPRVGRDGRVFSIHKLRSMRVDAESAGPAVTFNEDARVTRVGRFLRRTKVDELPQLLNVLKGEMSLVGPRPLPLRDYKQLSDWHRKRYLVLPGITGLWQIAGRSNLGFDDLVRLDFYYLETWSIWLDITIMVKTIPAVLSGRGAY